MPGAANVENRQRNISVLTSVRRIPNALAKSGVRLSSIDTNSKETSLELDSHADTCVLGKHCLVISNYDRPVTVYGYDKALGAQTFDTVSAVVGYTDPSSGSPIHLVIHQGIHIKHLEHHLLCPMQCRVNGVVINECPRFQDRNPTAESHSIVIDENSPDSEEKVILPLSLSGVTSYLPVHVPSMEDWISNKYPRYELTNEQLDWDPCDDSFQQQEDAMTDVHGQLAERHVSRGRGLHSNTLNISYTSSVPVADISQDDNLSTVLLNKVQMQVSAVSGGVKSTSHKNVDAQSLARRWSIPLHRAKNTVQMTTQRGIRSVLHPSINVRRPTNDRMLRYPRMPHDVMTDTLIAGIVSQQGNKYSQVYGTSFGWARAHSMKTKGAAHETLSLLFKRDGVPPTMLSDGSKEQAVKKEFRAKLREVNCHYKMLEAYSPWTNAAEMNIRELKRGSSRKMIRTQSPKKLWDHCLELEAYIRSHTAHDMYPLNGQVPETLMKGNTADISNICEYEWYQWVMYIDSACSYPDDKWVLGRYLGPAIDTGSMMTSKILRHTGNHVCRSTIRPLREDELTNPAQIKQREQWDQLLHDKLGQPATAADFDDEDLTPSHDFYLTDDIKMQGSPDDLLAAVPDPEDLPLPTPEADDNLVGASVMLPLGGTLARGRVTERKRDAEGNVSGTANANPILDTREYRVEFENGEVSELAANAIAESMYAMCDEDGHQVLMFDSVLDHKKDDTALNKLTQVFVDGQGRKRYKRSTKGWFLCVQWKDGSTSWEKLADFKECYPVQVAEYALARGIDHEPAFNWWVKHTLRKRDSIISLVQRRQTRYLKKTSKFGVELPKTVAEALELDKKNGNTLWADAIAKEMKNVKIAFDILPDGAYAPRDYQRVVCHMIFDVKMEDFRRKARLVAGGHLTDTPKCMTYSSVVSRESVRIALTIAALNDLEVKAGDIMNAYVTAPITEKVWTVLGKEWGADAGKKAIIVRALYGLKSAGAAFRRHLADCMRNLGYKSCPADHDLWIKPAVDNDGDKYYSYILCYVDDILVIHHDAMPVMTRLTSISSLSQNLLGTQRCISVLRSSTIGLPMEYGHGR